MKALLFILLASVALAEGNNYALVNADGTVIEVFVATPDVAQGYPQVATQAFPDAVRCVPALGAGIGWHYDATSGAFTPPIPETTLNVTQVPQAFTLQDPTPVITTNNVIPIITTNNIAVTTNNAILTTNNTQ